MFTQMQKMLVTTIAILGCLLLDLWLWRHGCPQWVTILMILALGLNLGGWLRRS